jgi:hypothetical protein
VELEPRVRKPPVKDSRESTGGSTREIRGEVKKAIILLQFSFYWIYSLSLLVIGTILQLLIYLRYCRNLIRL